MSLKILQRLRVLLLDEDSNPSYLVTTDAQGNIGKVPISTSEAPGGSGGCCRTIDGGAPDTVYLPTQNIEGGTPDDVGTANNHIDGGFFTL